MFVGSGYRAAAFEVEAAYSPGSPPTINGHHPPATPVNSSATTSPSRKFAGPTERRAPRTARPFGGGAPRRIRLGLTSFRRSTAVPTGPGQRPSLPVRQLQSRRLGPRDGRDRHRNGQHPHGRRFDRVIPPEFVDAAQRVGIRASLSVPLLIGGLDSEQELVDSLNSYSHTAIACDPFDAASSRMLCCRTRGRPTPACRVRYWPAVGGPVRAHRRVPHRGARRSRHGCRIRPDQAP